MVSKTRERLIEVARQLFARNGVENTTMADIANASEKGRRTIYTYFKNKREIHQAVIDRESEQLVARERRIQQSPISSESKLESFLRIRFDTMLQRERERQADPLSLRNLLEWNRIGKTRRLAAMKEMEILRQILREGVDNGEFDINQASRMEPIAILLANSIYSPLAKETLELLGYAGDMAYDRIVSFLVAAVKCPPRDAADKFRPNN